MNWQLAAGAAGSAPSDGGVSWGVIVLGILGFLALVAVCGFGVLARLRDRAADRRSLEALRAERMAASRRETGRSGHHSDGAMHREGLPGDGDDVGNGAIQAG